jgi:FkbM family methyltransferase
VANLLRGLTLPAAVERAAAAAELLRSPLGRHALRSWRPRSIAAWRLTTGVLQRGLSPATVIDVGANAGQFARAAAEVFPGCRVISFEPLPEAADAFEQNLADCADVELRRTAVGASAGSVAFHPHEYSLASSVLARDPEASDEAWTGERAPIDVPVVRLDDAVDLTAVEAPLLLKLDVQGYEAEVLSGAQQVLQRCDAVLVELALVRAYTGQPLAAELIALLAGQGWRLDAVLDVRSDRTGQIAELDALFTPSPALPA